jgi:hypothetical protein
LIGGDLADFLPSPYRHDIGEGAQVVSLNRTSMAAGASGVSWPEPDMTIASLAHRFSRHLNGQHPQ